MTDSPYEPMLLNDYKKVQTRPHRCSGGGFARRVPAATLAGSDVQNDRARKQAHTSKKRTSRETARLADEIKLMAGLDRDVRKAGAPAKRPRGRLRCHLLLRAAITARRPPQTTGWYLFRPRLHGASCEGRRRAQ